MITGKSLLLVAVVSTSLLLSGCESVSNMLGSSEDPPLKGERISILQLQQQLVPDPALQQSPIVLPESWENKLWPQSGGYPNHAMGHLAFGASLKKAWSSSIGEAGDRRSPLTTSPVVSDNLIFTIDTEGNVSAFDLATGKKKWRESIVPKNEKDTTAIGGGLALSEGKLFAASGYNYLHALDPVTGKILWKVATPAPARAAPTVMNNRIFLTTIDNRLMVYATDDGRLLWKHTGVSETTNMLGAASVAVDDTTVVLPLSSGEIYGLSVENGNVLWQDNLSAVRRVGAFSSISDIRGMPVIDQGVVYAVSYSGRMVALNQTTGDRLWQREIGSGETPWAAGDVVFAITAEQQLTALSRQTGGIYWVTQLPRFTDGAKGDAVVWSGPILAGGRLFLASNHEELAEADPMTGKLIKTHSISGGTIKPPIVVGHTLLILTSDGKLTAYR
jgi:outer membrane protein assembly factor BamB